MYLPGNEYDIHTAQQIYSRQCSSTVRTLLEAHGGDVTEIIRTAENAKLNKKQREALEEWNKQKDSQEEIENQLAYKGTAAILEILQYHKEQKNKTLKENTLEKLKEKMEKKIDKTLTNAGKLSVVEDDGMGVYYYAKRAKHDRTEYALKNDLDLPFD